MLIRNVLAPLLLPDISLAKHRYIGAFDIYPLIQHKVQIIRYTIQKNVNNKKVFLIKQIPSLSSITKQMKVNNANTFMYFNNRSICCNDSCD